ncbi:MAG: beta-propeller domain-containing protein [Nocardioidaceae bacterium]|nr:beta-propeller domain-containing protein [Nocardioidaceae bacterium]
MECTLVQHPAAASATSTITVLRIDPSQPADVDVTAVSADGNLVYSSLDRLYVATTDWGWGWQSLRDGERQPTTAIHAFSVDGTQTEYVASGTVAGTVPDRWAFSEYDGNLRVASTLGQVWSPRETVVTVFEEDADRLSVVGSVGGLGENEQIHAVRWFDEVAVIVTFRQVDPLYTVDLGDPTSPRVLGELKIPGFSEYLHPIGDDLLLGVGQDATNQGQLRGSQLSTFDLTELTDVTRLATLGLGTHVYSAVEEDSRAFTYLADQRLAFIPVSDWSGGSEVAVARVDDQGRLDLVTTIELSGWGGDARVLPIEDDRVAVVSHGRVVQLLDVNQL